MRHWRNDSHRQPIHLLQHLTYITVSSNLRLQFKGSCCKVSSSKLTLAAVHSPSLLSAAGQESLCPLDKPHFCGSSAGISRHHVGIQEENFTLVTLKQQKITLKASKQTHPEKNQENENKKDKGTFTRNKQLI